MISVQVFTTPSLGKKIPKTSGDISPGIESEGWISITSNDQAEIERIKALFPEDRPVNFIVGARYPHATGESSMKKQKVWHRESGVSFGEAI